MNDTYHLFGLNIVSEIHLPGPKPAVNVPDVTINYGTVPGRLVNPRISEKGEVLSIQFGVGEFLLRVAGVAAYYVAGGCRITVQPEPDVETERVLIFLTGSAIGALLYQRGLMVLHASAMMVNGKCLAFTGDSGMGKSTLAAGLHRRGHAVLADDLCALSLDKGLPFVSPGFSRLKLWGASLKKIGCPSRPLERVRWDDGRDKFFLPVDMGNAISVPLNTVFVLETSENRQIDIVQIKGMEKIDALIQNTYRYIAVNGFDLKKKHFQQCCSIGSNIEVNRLIRPREGFWLEELMDCIETYVSGEQNELSPL